MTKYRVIKLGDLPIWRVEREVRRWFQRSLKWVCVPYFTDRFAPAYAADFEHDSQLAAVVEMEKYEHQDRIDLARKNNAWRRVV